MNTEDLVRINQRLAAIEQKLDHLYAHHGLDAPPPPAPGSNVSPEVLDAVKRGSTIEAVKLYRAETGCDLATAKAEVDRIASGGLIV